MSPQVNGQNWSYPMRLVSFETGDRRTYGLVRDDRVHEATAAFRESYPDLRAVLTAGKVAETEVESKGLDFAEVLLLSPIPNPEKIICVGLNYANHIKETGREKP